MKSSKDALKIVIYTLSTVSTVIVVFMFLNVLELNSKFISTLSAATLGALASTYIAFIMKTLNKNPTPLKTAIVGLPGSGKTVYLSVLFNELQLYSSDSVKFQPYGRETIEKVEQDIKIIQSGNWLTRTGTDSVFYYRANAHVKGGLFPKKYTVELADYAGEKTEEFNSTSDSWLHKTDYFKYVITSDIIFLAVDGSLVANNYQYDLQEVQSKLVAAVQVLLDEKGIDLSKQLEVPVALLILKSDLLAPDFNPVASGHFDRLIPLCQKRCHNFSIFLVSSVGKVDEDGLPIGKLAPRNVADPMVWALRRVRL